MRYNNRDEFYQTLMLLKASHDLSNSFSPSAELSITTGGMAKPIESRPPPKKMRNLSPASEQRLILQKLLSKPDAEIDVNPPKPKPAPPPADVVSSIGGSSAASGSGEFFVYRASKRRETERLAMMEEERQREESNEMYEKRITALQQHDDAKTLKNRRKREKAKQRKSGQQVTSTAAAAETEEDTDTSIPVTKLEENGSMANEAQLPEMKIIDESM